MAKEIQYSRISTKLQNLKAAHPQDVSAKLWNETFKGLINGGESMRLFDVFSGSLGLLEARNKRYMKWSSKANSNNWTSDWVQNLFEKHNIISKFGPSTDATGKALHPRTNYPHKVAMIIEQPVEQPAVEATIEQSVPKWMNVPAPEGPLEDVAGPDLTRLTDGQLNMLKWHIATEENRRRIEAKKAELLKVFSEMAKDEGFSLEDIMG